MIHVDCCVAGGGPAGVMLGLLLARQGVRTLVLEKHKDFLRDFRGDTVHPSTLELLAELGWAEELLRLPHTRLDQISMDTDGRPLVFADFRRLPVRHPYVAFMPQWDLLNFLAEKASAYPCFQLRHNAEVVDLTWDSNRRVTGVSVDTPNGPLQVSAQLVVGADGRHSTVRRCARLIPLAKSAPMDVLWFRLSRHPDEELTFFQAGPGSVLVCINRGEYWQLAYVIAHGHDHDVRAAGLPAFRSSVATLVPELADRVEQISDWAEVKLLSVRVDRLRRWSRPGLLCIGDAAHAMSPAGGVGINLAIQDAVATANILGPTFAHGGPPPRALRQIQRRRMLPTWAVQTFQVTILRGLYPQHTDAEPTAHTALPHATAGGLRLLRRVPALRHLAGRFIGMGIRPEHIAPRNHSTTS